MNAFQLEAEELEERLSKSVGGPATQPTRSVLAFTLGLLISAGVDLDALDSYISQTIALTRRHLKR